VYQIKSNQEMHGVGVSAAMPEIVNKTYCAAGDHLQLLKHLIKLPADFF